jgi:hypothetical protein
VWVACGALDTQDVDANTPASIAVPSAAKYSFNFVFILVVVVRLKSMPECADFLKQLYRIRRAWRR